MPSIMLAPCPVAAWENPHTEAPWSCAAAELPGGRPRPVPARGDRAGAAPVHRRRQRRGAAVQPRPAALGVRSSKLENNYFGFGTDNDIEHTDGLPDHQAPHVLRRRRRRRTRTPARRSRCRREGARRARAAGARRSGPHSVVNISGDELRLAVGPAIEALNRGAALAGCLHNTGEGGLSPYHRNGGDLIFQIGTAYFGCRDEHGRFDLRRGSWTLVAVGAGAGDRDQAQPGRQAGARRHAARRRR